MVTKRGWKSPKIDLKFSSILGNFESPISSIRGLPHPYPLNIAWNWTKLCGNVPLGQRIISTKFEQISCNLRGVLHAHKKGQFQKLVALFIAPPVGCRLQKCYLRKSDTSRFTHSHRDPSLTICTALSDMYTFRDKWKYHRDGSEPKSVQCRHVHSVRIPKSDTTEK